MRRALLATMIAFVLLTACKPKFEPSGTLSVDGAAFSPSECHTLADGGIELFDATGARLTAALDPTTLEAFKDISGTPRVEWKPRSDPAVELGPCGTLALTGEGFHGSGRRAASGRLSVDCSGGVKVKGSLSFSGCF